MNNTFTIKKGLSHPDNYIQPYFNDNNIDMINDSSTDI